jgi:hypothetical protein
MTEDDDPLGKLQDQFFVSILGLILVGGVLLLGGGGVAAAGWFLLAPPYSYILLAVGGFLLLMVVGLIVTQLPAAGKKLEVRAHGLRFTANGRTQELRWDEIERVDVSRTDDTNYGLVSVEKRSKDTASGSGLLTDTEWDVTVHGTDGESIYLGPAVWKMMPNARKVINEI